MFTGLRTYNPYFGCKHHCYNDGCFAKKRLAHRIGTGINCQLCYDFKPHFHPKRLTRIPKDPRLFVGAHCDQFAEWVESGTIFIILDACKQTPKDQWFYETKNPRRYLEFLKFFPENTMLSTTIETNRVYNTKIRGRTPTPDQRLDSMLDVKEHADFPLHIAVEPILDFDLPVMVEWMRLIEPVKVAIGYDSLGNHLPSPPVEKTEKLIKELEGFTEVERKQIP